MKEEILKLRAQGKNYNEISKILGCSKGTISYHCGNGQKEKYREYDRNRKEKNRKWLQSIKEKLSCSKCDEKRWWVLDFHHLDPTQKENSISNLLIRFNKNKIIEEIDKCIVLCANCHRDLHYQEKNNWIQTQGESPTLDVGD